MQSFASGICGYAEPTSAALIYFSMTISSAPKASQAGFKQTAFKAGT